MTAWRATLCLFSVCESIFQSVNQHSLRSVLSSAMLNKALIVPTTGTRRHMHDVITP